MCIRDRVSTQSTWELEKRYLTEKEQGYFFNLRQKYCLYVSSSGCSSKYESTKNSHIGMIRKNIELILLTEEIGIVHSSQVTKQKGYKIDTIKGQAVFALISFYLSDYFPIMVQEKVERILPYISGQPRDYSLGYRTFLEIQIERTPPSDTCSFGNAGSVETPKTPYSLERNRAISFMSVSYTHLRAHETSLHLVCRLLLEKKKKKNTPKPHHTFQSNINFTLQPNKIQNTN
eukprot:TRINITY_DN3077_c0_g1_i1.p1 TRINITY_DN3077_c0_g1~~TRINITY_DN3077_c0_g1_i1.p1  ORF type:complete len:232 (+),score=20.30 TRINITY_DN3077_c0_g1_i1:178-873(+)